MEDKTVGEMATKAFRILEDCLYTLFSQQTYDENWTPKIRATNIRMMMEHISTFYLDKYEEYKEYMNVLSD